jgi:hypothetical protein
MSYEPSYAATASGRPGVCLVCTAEPGVCLLCTAEPGGYPIPLAGPGVRPIRSAEPGGVWCLGEGGGRRVGRVAQVFPSSEPGGRLTRRSRPAEPPLLAHHFCDLRKLFNCRMELSNNGTHGRQESNPQHTALETGALPVELRP